MDERRIIMPGWAAAAMSVVDLSCVDQILRILPGGRGSATLPLATTAIYGPGPSCHAPQPERDPSSVIAAPAGTRLGLTAFAL